MNGQLVETENVFVDDGTEMRFTLDDVDALIKATSGDKKRGIVQELFIQGKLIEEDTFA